MDFLSQQDNRRAIRRALEQLPETLDASYDDAMERIQNQNRPKADRALQILSWISCAFRPLTIQELQHALAIAPDDTYFDEEALPDLESLVPICAGLIMFDQESQIVRLVHYTTQEYFKRSRSIYFPFAHRDMAMSCLTYVDFPPVQKACFLEYAAMYWGRHANGDLDGGLEDKIIKFLTQNSSLYASPNFEFGYAVHRYQLFGGQWGVSYRTTPLCAAAMLGLDKVMASLLEMGLHVDSISEGEGFKHSYTGDTPLHGAAWAGQMATAQLLIQHEADIEAKTYRGYTPLHVAVVLGHHEVVRLLLAHGADVNTKARRDISVLTTAIMWNRVAIVQMLLENNVNLEVSYCDITPLGEAAHRGHSEMANLLLQHGAKIESAVGEISPLWLAAVQDHHQLVRLLLEHGADIEAEGQKGETVLAVAIRLHRKAVVQVLLEHNPDRGRLSEEQKNVLDKEMLLRLPQERKNVLEQENLPYVIQSLFERFLESNPTSLSCFEERWGF